MAAVTSTEEAPGDASYRDDIRWTSENYNVLKTGISERQACSPYKLAVFGALQSGKSSFINTLLSAMQGKYKWLAHSAPSDYTVTKQLQQYPLRGAGGTRLPVLLCDTMGYESAPDVDQCVGPNQQDVELILDGQIAHGYTFEEAGIRYDDMLRHGEVGESVIPVNLVLIVWDASWVPDLAVVKHLKHVTQAAHDRKISCCALLTKVDKISAMVDRDLTQVFHQDDVQQVIEQVSAKLELNQSCIFPMKNYTSETSSLPINCLALDTLAQLLDMADATLERQHGLPEDRVIRLLPEPWNRTRIKARTEALENLAKATAASTVDDENINVAMMGLRGAGKSEFINAIQSALHGKPWHYAATGQGNDTPITKKLTAWTTPLKVTLYDTMGLSAVAKQGLHKQDVLAVVQGKFPPGASFNMLEAYQSQAADAPLADQTHAVVLVIDGSTFGSLSREEVALLQSTYHSITETGVPCVVALSHTDKMCQHVQKNASNMYYSATIQQCVREVHSSLRIPMDDILPVLTVPDLMLEEEAAEAARYDLMLHTLTHLCHRAMDYVRMQPRKATVECAAEVRVEASSMRPVLLAAVSVLVLLAALLLATMPDTSTVER